MRPSLAWLAAVAFSGSVVGRVQHLNILDNVDEVKDTYDYVIAGGGTAGLTVADRLSADGKYSVLVVEHGVLDNSSDILQASGSALQSNRLYNITSIPQLEMNNRSEIVWVGDLVGGSSAINGMAFMRGTSDEYDGWATLGGPNSTWDWKGTLPYFKKAAYFTPPHPDLAKAFNISYDIEAAWGQDPNTHIYASYSPNQDPAIIPVYNTLAKMPGVERPKDGCAGSHGLFWLPASINPVTFTRSYSRSGHFDNLTRSNYELITGQKVNKIVFNGTTAVGVQFIPRGGTGNVTVVKAAKEVILALGTIHTPQVLQLSGVGPKSLLDKAKIPILVDLPGVGQKFQDQSFISSIAFSWGNGTGPPAPKVNITRVPGQRTNYNTVARLGFPVVSERYDEIATSYGSQDPAAHLPEGSHPTVVAGYKAFQQLHAKQLRKKNVSFFGTLVSPGPGGPIMHLHVLSHGTVNIDPAQPDAEPVVDYRALTNPTDLQILAEHIRWMRRFMAHPDFAPYAPTEISPGANVTSDAGLAEWIRKVISPTLRHPIGTAAKMPRELGGVVGEDLLVHGTSRLSVVDASIMPTMPGGPTSQTVYMIAEKAVDLIKARQ